MWDFDVWETGRELEPVHLRNAGQTQSHRGLSLDKRKADGTLDEEGMFVSIARLTKLDI